MQQNNKFRLDPSGLAIPAQIPPKLEIGFGSITAPLAFPLGSIIQEPGKIQMLAFGGLTKLEHGALLIAAGMVEGVRVNLTQEVDNDNAEDISEMLQRISAMSSWLAQAVLRECQKFQHPPAEENPL